MSSRAGSVDNTSIPKFYRVNYCQACGNIVSHVRTHLVTSTETYVCAKLATSRTGQITSPGRHYI
eukprot:scaffold333311_cov23-Prasinocladus_malaysianus.AAC.1